MNQASPRETVPSAAKARFDPRRVYVGLVAVPLLYVLVVYGPPIGLTALALITGLLAAQEFFRLYLDQRAMPPVMYASLLGIGLILAAAHWPEVFALHHALIVYVLVMLSMLLIPIGPTESRLTDAAISVMGMVYLGLLLSFAVRTRALPEGAWLLCFLFMVTWGADIGAYYVGSLFGRHALAPRISPKKTLEGLAGGLVVSVGAAFAARAWFLPSFTPTDCLWTGLLLTGAGLLGDLAESALKRSAGVKDSGALLPGHGGMLDRIDSLLCTAPVFYYYVALVKG